MKKKYFVEITLPTAIITYYFTDLGGNNGAATFFYRYCKRMGFNKPKCLNHSTRWAREKSDGLTIDFEKIMNIEIHSIFNPQ